MDQGKSSPPAGLDAYIVFIVCVAVLFFFHVYFSVITTFAYMSLATIIFAFCNTIVSSNTYNTESTSIKQTVRPVAKIKPVLRDSYDNLNYLHRGGPNSTAFQPIRRPLSTSLSQMVTPNMESPSPTHELGQTNILVKRHRLQIAKMMLVYIYYSFLNMVAVLYCVV